jgi:ubiquinone/menaquinone biosynthesis C-methylase UbiE
MSEEKKQIIKDNVVDAHSLLEEAGIEEKMTVADLGCGSRGYFAIQAAKLIGEDGLIYAVDIVKSALQNVQNTARLFGITNLRTVWGDLERPQAIKIPAESLDLAMLNNMLFQNQKRDEIIKEATRLLKKQGKLLITDWKKTKTPLGPPLGNRISPEEIKKIAEKTGLEYQKELMAGPYHYALMFVKK